MNYFIYLFLLIPNPFFERNKNKHMSVRAKVKKRRENQNKKIQLFFILLLRFFLSTLRSIYRYLIDKTKVDDEL